MNNFEFNENTFDPYSLLLILPEFEMPVESSKRYNIVDAGKVREIELTNEGFRKIKTPYGTFLAYTLTPSKDDESRKGSTPISSIRVIAPDAVLVCKVDITK